MSKIKPIADKIITKPLKKFANSSLMENVCKNYRNNNDKFITAFSVASIVAKDGYGCYIYVKQNEKNKEIPEDKRKFLTGLDLANGLLMMGVQVATFFALTKTNAFSKLFNKTIGKNFTAEKLNIVTKNVQNKLPKTSPDEIAIVFDKVKKDSATAFNHLSSLVCTTMLAKRVAVPLIATPFADFYKKKMSNENSK